MRLLSLLLPVLSLLSSTVRAQDSFGDGPLNTRSVTLHKWPLSAASPIPLGTVGYNPRTRTGDFDAAGDRTEVADGEVVRVGVWDGKDGWFGSVTTGKLLKDPSKAVVTLRLDDAGNVWHVEYRSDDMRTSPSVTVLNPTPGPQPHLNKPIVLTPDGRVPVKEVEKSFLQKYWWVLLGGALLLMTSGGSE